MKFKKGDRVIYRNRQYGDNFCLLELIITKVYSLHRILKLPEYQFEGTITGIIKEGAWHNKIYIGQRLSGCIEDLTYNTNPNILLKQIL